MPDQTITVLLYTCGVLFACYLVLVFVTVSYAAKQNTLAAEARTVEGNIASLENTYYQAVAREDAATPESVGLVAPTDVEYAVAKSAEGLTFARN